MDGCAFRRNCSSSSAPRLAAIVIRDAANRSVEKRKHKDVLNACLRRPWAVVLVIFLVSDGTARPGRAPFGNSDDLRAGLGG
jgi:hypothetical protein